MSSKPDVPVLMSLPAGEPGPGLAIAAPRSPVGREFSELAHLVIGAMGRGRHVILVPGVSRGQATGLVAANLAAALSRNQPDVTLICADLEGSVISEMSGLPSGPGLTDVLADDIWVGDTEQRLAAAPQLRVIPPGSSAGPDADDIRQDALERLLDELEAGSGWVVLEGPAVSARPDISTLAHVADAAVLVAEIPRTRTDQLIDGARHLGKMGAHVLGVALLPAPRESGRARPMPVLPDGGAALDGNAGPPEYAAISPPSVADEPVKESGKDRGHRLPPGRSRGGVELIPSELTMATRGDSARRAVAACSVGLIAVLVACSARHDPRRPAGLADLAG